MTQDPLPRAGWNPPGGKGLDYAYARDLFTETLLATMDPRTGRPRT